MHTVSSADGTTIALQQAGTGPAVVLVDGALCYRAFGPLSALADQLSDGFTVYTYDRRGRGDSGDTPPYDVEREIEDLAAVIDAAGGTAFVYGISSGAALALRAAAAGVSIHRLALYEPPFATTEADRARFEAYGRTLLTCLAEGRRGDAVEAFLVTTGMPPEMVAGMRREPVWPVFEAVAPTLAYDRAILGDGLPTTVAAGVMMPVLVLAGGDSPPMLTEPAKRLADLLPQGEHRSLAGQTHDVQPEVLAPELAEFFAS